VGKAVDQEKLDIRRSRHAETLIKEDSHGGANADHTHRNEFVNSKEGRALYGDAE